MYQANATFGDYYRDLGEHTKAIPFYRNCLKFDSENYSALYGLFMCLSFIGDESGAEFYSKKFFSLYSDTFFNDHNDTISEEDTYNSTITGIPMIYDETGSTPYPTIAKIFNNKSDFNHTVTKIKDSIDLFQYFDKPLYIDIDEKIKVNILALEDDLLLQILFGNDYKLFELNVDRKDLNLFIELFNEYKQFRI